MISPELLRRYPFFSKLEDHQLRALAMLGQEIEANEGTVIFEEQKEAEWLCLLVEGSIELSFKSEEQFHPKGKKEFAVGDINPGEVFGISAMIEPFRYNATAKTQTDFENYQIRRQSLAQAGRGRCDPGM